MQVHGVSMDVSMSSKPRLLTRSACRNCSSLWPLQTQHLQAVAVCERSEVMGSLPPHSETAAGPGTIRRGAPEDAAFLARCNVDHGLEVENLRLDPAEVRAGVDAVLADDTKGHYWVLEIDGSLAAGLLITYEWSDWNNANYWWIQSLFVVKQHRRKGCYRQLYAHVQQHARRADAAGVRLYADVGNTIACAMYETLGMTSHYKVYEASFIEEVKAEPEAG